jgi:hypothetical protein
MSLRITRAIVIVTPPIAYLVFISILYALETRGAQIDREAAFWYVIIGGVITFAMAIYFTAHIFRRRQVMRVFLLEVPVMKAPIEPSPKPQPEEPGKLIRAFALTVTGGLLAYLFVKKWNAKR